jgi:hypothetical protein
MSFFSRIANGLGTLLGVLADSIEDVIVNVKKSYNAYRGRSTVSRQQAREETEVKKNHLREVNDEIMGLRNKRMSRGSLTEAEQRRWQSLKEQRDELLGNLNQAREVQAAEKIIESEDRIEKVDVDLETTHVLQYNAFADALGKRCRKCGRQMKLQWKRDLAVAEPQDFFWGCTGWYVQTGAQARACTHTERLQRNDYGLMTDTTEPEFSVTAEEFGIILTDPGTSSLIEERMADLRTDLSKSHRGVELSTCPVHGENMVLRHKDGAVGLMDAYFLACPHWLPKNQGCTFIDKLKSGSQLAALLKSQTGRGVL